jgi:hypothetical protein
LASFFDLLCRLPRGLLLPTPATDPLLLDPTFPFRFEVVLQRCRLQWKKTGLALPDGCRMPCLGALADRPLYADLRMAWDTTGIGFSVRATGKRQLPWCRDSRIEESDGLHLWIDTRCSPGIHRANRFCHRFLFMPIGGGPKRDIPVATQVPIQRARQHPNPIASSQLNVSGRPKHDGYELSGIISADALTGFDPRQYPRIGIWYAVVDRERGWQTFSLGPDFPVADDPTLWGDARLVG